MTAVWESVMGRLHDRSVTLDQFLAAVIATLDELVARGKGSTTEGGQIANESYGARNDGGGGLSAPAHEAEQARAPGPRLTPYAIHGPHLAAVAGPCLGS